MLTLPLITNHNLKIDKKEQFFEYIQHFPDLLHSIPFIEANLSHNYLSFKNYPKEVQSNPFFIQAYFSKNSVNIKEYAFIPNELLSNEFFIHSVIVKNPDIYLLADSKTHNSYMFNLLKHYHPDTYLKYAEINNINNFDFCYQAIKENKKVFAFLPDHFKQHSTIFAHVFPKNLKYQYDEPLVASLTKQQHRDTAFIQELLQHNIGAFPYLNKSYYNDKKLCETIVRKKSAYFEFISKELKNDKEWVLQLLDNSNNVNYHNTYDNFIQFYPTDIIKNLPLDYFSLDFCEQHYHTIQHCFNSLSKSHRESLPILKTIFNPKFFRPSEYSFLLSNDYFNSIPNENIKTFCKLRLKEYKNKGEQGQIIIIQQIFNFIDKAALQQTLIDNLPIKQSLPSHAKVKI